MLRIIALPAFLANICLSLVINTTLDGDILSFRQKRQQSDSIVFIDEFSPPGQRQQLPCQFPGRSQGICTAFLGCPHLVSLLENPTGGHLQLIQQSICGYENNAPKVCCPDRSVIAALLQPPANPQPPPPPRPVQPSQNLPLQQPTTLPSSCGIPKFITTRIVGGKESTPGSWPWMAALGYVLPDGSLFFGCGGALVTNRHVITAAHCTSEGEDLLHYVRLGAHNLPSPGQPQGHSSAFPENKTPFEQIPIERKIIHPEYVRKKLSKNDIAILKLVRTVQFNDYIQPICLAWEPNVRNRDLLGKQAFTAGWGTTLFNRKEPSPYLQHVGFPVADLEVCKKAYSKIKTSITFDETVLCAGDGSGKADSCQGDSGGPLMMDIDGAFYLVGVVSSGYRCAEPGFYGVYMKTTQYLEWIAKSLNE